MFRQRAKARSRKEPKTVCLKQAEGAEGRIGRDRKGRQAPDRIGPEDFTEHLLSRCACMLSRFGHVQLLATPLNRQTPLSLGFSGLEYWSGLPWLLAGDLPNPGTKPGSPVLQAILY